MNKLVDDMNKDVLDQETLEALGDAASAVTLDDDTSQRMRANILQRLGPAPDSASFYKVDVEQGEWHEIRDRVDKKVLHIDERTGVESYLLRLQPGAEIPRHYHDHDEHCVCVEGDVEFDDIELTSGDYFFAPAGSWHGASRSINGALLFLQAQMAA